MASKYLKRTTAKERQNNITNSNKNLHEKTNMVGEKEPYIRCKSKLLFFIENIS